MNDMGATVQKATIGTRVDEGHKLIGELEEKIEFLNKRLEHVLRPIEAKETQLDLPTSGSPMNIGLTELCNRLSKLIGKIDLISNHLDL